MTGFLANPATPPDPNSNQRAAPWSAIELQLIVADYLDMLLLDLNGQKFNKAARRRALLPLLNGRSEASIEFKRCNISAVMEDFGLPAVRGYLRRANYQSDLALEVERQLGSRAEIDDAARLAADRPLALPDELQFNRLPADPPGKGARKVAEPSPAYLRSPINRDHFEREARNRRLGLAGEELMVQFERWRLIEAGLGQLAERVEHVAKTKGDGLGYDVLSFRNDGRERFIEVKTTNFSATTPFYVSANEERFARDHAAAFTLARVYEFRDAPRFFELPGAISDHCHLDPATYKASFG